MYVSKYKYIYIYTSFELLFCYYIYTSLEAPTWRIKNQVTIRSSCMIRPSRRRSSRPFSKKLCQLPSWASSGAERQGFRFSCTGDTQMMKNHFKFSGYIYIYIFCPFLPSHRLVNKKSASPTSWNIAIPYSQKHPIRSGSNPSKQSSKIQLFGLRLGG